MPVELLIFGLIALLGLAGACSRFIPGLKPDNQVEELIESVLKAKLDIDIDLSPDTPDAPVKVHLNKPSVDKTSPSKPNPNGNKVQNEVNNKRPVRVTQGKK